MVTFTCTPSGTEAWFLASAQRDGGGKERQLMAIDMFMKLDDIKGESVDGSHKGEVDVLSWTWGASQAGSAQVGGGTGSGKVQVQDLSFSKYTDRASPVL